MRSRSRLRTQTQTNKTNKMSLHFNILTILLLFVLRMMDTTDNILNLSVGRRYSRRCSYGEFGGDDELCNQVA